MERRSRREAIAAGVAAVASLAGCSGTGDGGENATGTPTDATPTASETTTETGESTTREGPTDSGAERVAWSWDVSVASGPVVDGGTAFLGTASGDVHALTTAGERRWTYEAPAPARWLHPTDETLYLGSTTQTGAAFSETAVHAVDRATGRNRWTYAVGQGGRAVALLGVADGVLGVGLWNDYLQGSGEETLGLDAADGTVRWRVETGDVREGTAGPNTIYAAEYDELLALNPADGTKRWSRAADFADPPELLDGVALLGADTVHAVDPESGEPRWTYGTDLDLAGVDVLGGSAYTRGAVVASLTADGAERWRSEKGGFVDVADDAGLFGNRDRELFALETDGTERWTARRPAEHFDFGALTDGFVAGQQEDAVRVYDRTDGTEAYRFTVDGKHVRGMTAVGDRLLVAGRDALFALR